MIVLYITYKINCISSLLHPPANTQPYILRVVTDKNEINDVGNTGFDLKFKQVKCDE